MITSDDFLDAVKRNINAACRAATFDAVCREAVRMVREDGLEPEPWTSGIFDRIDLHVDRRAERVYGLTCHVDGAWAAEVCDLGAGLVTWSTCSGAEGQSQTLATALFAVEADVLGWIEKEPQS